MGVLYGELTLDRRDIVLMSSGDDWENQEVVQNLQLITPQLRKSNPPGAILVPATWATVTQVAKTFDLIPHLQWQPGPDLSQWIIEEILRRGAAVQPLARPETDREPMPHQWAGGFAIGMNSRFFLADEAGCGKSGSALLGLAELAARGKRPFPAAVVCPASVVDSWLEELEAWFPSWAVVAYRGARRSRLSRRYDLYVTSYNTFRNDMKLESQGVVPPFMRRIQPRTLISDEMHAACNSESVQSKALRHAAPYVPHLIGMSGTPITHGIGGFWAAMHCIDPAAFPSKERYKNRYALSTRADYGNPNDDQGLSPLRAQEFHTVMTGTMRRVAKVDVLTDLPSKSYSTRVVDVPEKWRAAYDEMQEDMLAHLPDDEDAVLPAPSVLTQLMRLQQLASSACDVTITTEWDERKGEEKQVVNVAMREPSWKVDELMAFMKEHDGSPVVTCAPHRQLVELAGRRAEGAGYRVGYIVGGQRPSVRTEIRQAFQRGETDLLCVTTDAGGVGLTLTAAYTMVFLERPWAYWQASQMEDRVHRISQTEKVHIVDIIARNTVETRVRETLKRKAKSLGELLQDGRLVREVLGGLPSDPGKKRAA